MSKPYIVSADIRLLLESWAEENDFTLPEEDYFHRLRKELRHKLGEIFPGFYFIPEKKLKKELRQTKRELGLPAITLEKVYTECNYTLEITRQMSSRHNLRGLSARAQAPSLLKQFRQLKESDLEEAIVVDDVIFTGSLLDRVIGLLDEIDIKVPHVVAGVAVQEGVDRINQNTDADIHYISNFENVIDEICERDFYPGVPLSGRLLRANGENIGIPYLLPFGDPVGWASIPANEAEECSRFFLRQTISLFKEIERLSEKQVYCKDLRRKVIDLPTDKTRYISALEKAFNSI